MIEEQLKKAFTLDGLFSVYLKQAGLDESKLSEGYKLELKKAFIAGISFFFQSLKFHGNKLKGKEGDEVFTYIQNQINEFFIKVSNREN